MRYLFAILAAAPALASAAAPVIRVTPLPGSPTLEAARDRIRELRAAGTLTGPATIEIGGGTFTLARPLALDRRDSGLTLRAAPGETVVVQGSIPILPGLNLLKPGRAVYGVHSSDRQFHPARHPDAGFATVPGTPVPFWQDLPDETHSTVLYPEALAPPGAMPGATLQIFPRYNWWNVALPIAAHDPSVRTLTLLGETPFPVRAGDRFFLEGSRAFLSAPGEYHHDPATGELEVLAPDAAGALHATVLDHLVSLSGCTGVTIEGIRFRHAATSAVKMVGSEDCRIAGCTLTRVGGMADTGAVAITGGTGNRVEDSKLHHLGSTGVHLTGTGHHVAGCEISHVGLRYKQGAGIRADGTGHTLAHNHIHHAPRWGIGFHGSGHTIESNLIQHVSLETSDTAAIYTNGGRRPTPLDVTIRDNTITDVPGHTRKPGTHTYAPGLAIGIYLDEGASGCDVYDNTVSRVTSGAVFVHGGHSNTISSNTFAQTGDRGAGFSLWDTTPADAPNIFEENTFVTAASPALKLENTRRSQVVIRGNLWGTDSPSVQADDTLLPLATWLEKKGAPPASDTP